jgi:hypothetical protein
MKQQNQSRNPAAEREAKADERHVMRLFGTYGHQIILSASAKAALALIGYAVTITTRGLSKKKD